MPFQTDRNQDPGHAGKRVEDSFAQPQGPPEHIDQDECTGSEGGGPSIGYGASAAKEISTVSSPDHRGKL